MKNCHVILFSILLLTSCTKNNNNNPQSKTYRGLNGSYINFTDTTWTAARDGNFVNISLNLSGITNCDKVTVRTVGDGVRYDFELPLKGNSFNQNVGIYFTALGASIHTINSAGTQIFGYKGTDTLKITLTSGKLTF